MCSLSRIFRTFQTKYAVTNGYSYGKKVHFTALLLSLCTAVSAQEQVSETRSNLERHVRTLASDRMLGRQAGTDQGMLASSYIVFSLKRWDFVQVPTTAKGNRSCSVSSAIRAGMPM